MEQKQLIVVVGKNDEAKQAAAFESVFIETAFSAKEIEESIEAEKCLGIDKMPCAFLSDVNSAKKRGVIGLP